MLTEDEFDSWKSRLKLPEYTLTILEAVRSSDPSRQVHSGKSNVCGNYPSQKMGVTIQFESHRDELSHIVEKLEHGLDVLEYYDQPPPIELLYLSKKGKPVRCRHTPDFFVIRRNSAGWEECKTQEELVKLAKEKPNRYVQDEEGCWHCPPGSEYASKLGLYYCLRSSAETNSVRLRNFTWLEPYFCGKSLPGNEAEKKALLSLVEALPGITFAELLLEADSASPDDINILIATEQVYVNLSAAPLAEPDRVRVFLNQEIAFAYEQITKTLPSTVAPSFPVLTVDVGISLSWDGEYWEILNTGTQKIALQKTDGKVINLSNSAFNALVERGEITGLETQAASNIHKQVEQILRRARPEDIEVANRRYEAIEPYLDENPPAYPPRSIRRWRDSYREAEKIYGNGYVGLIPQHSAKGSHEPKLDEAVLEFMAQFIAQHYETPKSRRVAGVYRAFKEACKAHEPSVEAPSEKRFRLEIQRRSGCEQTRVREGGRTEKEIKVVTEDLRRRKSGHAKRVEVSDSELVEHLNRAEVKEGELLKQRLQALENKIVLDIIEDQETPHSCGNGLSVEGTTLNRINQPKESVHKSTPDVDNSSNSLECYGEF